MQQTTECAICVQTFHRLRKPVACPRCDAVACSTCVKTFLIGNTIQAKCMSCQSAWDMEFVRMNLSKNFLDGEYRKHQMGALLSEGEASLGELQALVPIQNAMDKKKKEIQMVGKEIQEMHLEIKTLKMQHVEARGMIKQQTSMVARQLWRKKGVTLYELISLKGEVKLALWGQLYNLRNEMGTLQYRWRHGGDDPNATPPALDTPDKVPKNQFFMACPGKDCRGRLSTAYKCGLCTHWFCSDCHGDKGVDKSGGPHTCNADDKATVALLKQNTKPCPKCHEGIFKVSGCDQMWCVQCHTCFSWNSGKILNGVVHNPHFYAWQRDQHGGVAPRVPGDHPCCDGLPPFHIVLAKATRIDGWKNQQYVERSHRLATHLLDAVVPHIRRTLEENTVEYKKKWGVDYLKGHVSREEWSQKLYFAARRQERHQRLLHVVEMVIGAVGDILRSWPSEKEVLQSLQALYTYTNEQVALQNKHYGTKLAALNPMADEFFHV